MKAYPDIATTARGQRILEQFLQGLGGKEIKKHVSLGRPITVEDAVVLATEFETFEEVATKEDGIRKYPVKVATNRQNEDGRRQHGLGKNCRGRQIFWQEFYKE